MADDTLDDVSAEITHYGYEKFGDADWDKYSAKGIGAHNNQLVALRSAAVTPDIERRFGLKFGDELEITTKDGQTRLVTFDDRTSDKLRGRVDIYDPNKTLGDMSLASIRKVSGSTPTPPVQNGTTQSPDTSPLALMRARGGEDFQRSSDDDLIKSLSKAYPSIPIPKLETYARAPDGYKLIQDEVKNSGITPIGKFRQAYSQFSTVPDDTITSWLYAKADDPKVNWNWLGVNPKDKDGNTIPYQEFKDLVAPPDHLQAAWRNVASGFLGGEADLYDLPQRLTKMVGDAGGSLEQLHKSFDSFMGQWFPFYKQPVKQSNTWLDQASNTIEQQAGNYWQSFVNWASEQAKGFKKASQQTAPPQGNGFFDQLITGGEQAVGQLPSAALTFAGGPETQGAKLAMLMGIGMETTSGYGRARDAGEKDPGVQAIIAGGTNGLMRYVMNAPTGRIAAGILNATIGASSESLRRFAAGDDNNDITKTAAQTSLDFLIGAIAGKGKEKLPEAARHAYDETVAARDAGDIEKAQSLADQTLLLLPESLKQEVAEATVKSIQDVGNKLGVIPMGPGAVHETPPVILMGREEELPESLRGQSIFHDPLVNLREQSIFHTDVGEKGTPSNGPKETRHMEETPGGAPGVESTPEEPHYASPEEQIAAESKTLKEAQQKIRDKYKPQWDEIEANKEKLEAENHYNHYQVLLRSRQDTAMQNVRFQWEERQRRQKRQSENPDAKVDNTYYPRVDQSQAGFVLNPLLVAKETLDAGIEAFNNLASSLGEHKNRIEELWNERFNPEELGEGGKVAGAEIAKLNAERQYKLSQFFTAVFKQAEFSDKMKNGEQSHMREEYQNSKYTQAEQKQQFWQALQGKSTGDPALDRMIELQRATTDLIYQMDQKLGIKYDYRDNYIFMMAKDKATENQMRQAFNEKFPHYHGEPSFVHPRDWIAFTNSDAFKRFDQKTWNLERHFQARMFQSMMAWSKLDFFNTMKDLGFAYETKGADSRVKALGWPKVDAPNGKMYYLDPKANVVLSNAWGPSSLRDTLLGDWNKFAGKLKGLTIALKLAHSVYHPLHVMAIGPAHQIAQTARKAISGHVNPLEWVDAALNYGTMGAWGTIGGLVRYKPVIDALSSRRSFESLTPQQQWEARQLIDGGFSAHISSESKMQFFRRLSEIVPVLDKAKPLDNFMSKAYRIWTLSKMNRFFFNDMIPALKAQAALRSFDRVYTEHPEFMEAGFDAKRENARRQEFREAVKRVDRRMGEMFMDNLFWQKSLKEFSTAHLLSLGWTLGQIDYMGGVLHDLSQNTVHVSDTIKKIKENPAQAVKERFQAEFTEPILYAALYTGMAALRGGVLAYLTGNKDKLQTLYDYFVPPIGSNPDGSTKRARTPEFPQEYISIARKAQNEGVGGAAFDTAKNKLQPELSTLISALTNKDYRGKNISDDSPFTQKGFMDRMGYILSNSGMSISGPTIFEAAKNQITGSSLPPSPQDALLSFFGFSETSKALERTPLENRIMETSRALRGPGGSSKAEEDKFDFKYNYEQAVRYKDEKAMKEGEDQMREHGYSEKQIHNARKDALVPPAKKSFKYLPAQYQEELWGSMTPDEQKEYLPFLDKKARIKLLHPPE